MLYCVYLWGVWDNHRIRRKFAHRWQSLAPPHHMMICFARFYLTGSGQQRFCAITCPMKLQGICTQIHQRSSKAVRNRRSQPTTCSDWCVVTHNCPSCQSLVVKQFPCASSNPSESFEVLVDINRITWQTFFDRKYMFRIKTLHISAFLLSF